MKKFNQIIEVQVSIDDIADKLLSTIDKSNPHSELIAETIIGNLANITDKIGISQLYTALNGYTNDINFQENQHVICNDTYYGYDPISEKIGRYFINDCVILKIDKYKRDNVLVSYVFQEDKDSESKQYKK